METQENSIRTFGVKSKAAVFVVNHPFYSVSMVAIITMLLTYAIKDPNIHYHWEWGPISLFIIVGITRIVARNYCYRVDLDTTEGTIKFFLAFGQGVVSGSLSSLKIIANCRFLYLIGGRKLIINLSKLTELIDLLPDDMQIVCEGWLWRYVGYWIWGPVFKKTKRKNCTTRNGVMR